MSLPLLAALLFASPADRIAADFSKALKSRDYAWCEKYIAKEFVYRGLDGTRQDRAETLGHVRRWFHPLGYRVGADVTLVSSRKSKSGLLLVSDLKVRSQLFGFRRMPLTETVVRNESFWALEGGEWTVRSIVELTTRKTVDGKPVEP